MAYQYCHLSSELTGSKNISLIQASKFGNPGDSFEIKGNTYTMAFLNYYIRYCFAQNHISFKGNEVIVELGSGSGHQIEILKKLYPSLTILCFDLPVQLFVCEQYLSHVLGKESIMSVEETVKWKDLKGLKKGGVHFFGSWQFPLLKEFKFDLFCNAASPKWQGAGGGKNTI
jgi:putative sugar O-methyltransferase